MTLPLPNNYPRIARFFVVVLFMLAAAPGMAQNGTRDRITLDLHKASMDTVLLLSDSRQTIISTTIRQNSTRTRSTSR